MKNNSFFAFVAGALAGAAIALLLAPDSGENTRRKLKQAASDGLDAASEKAESLKEKIESVRERAESQMDAARDDIRDMIIDKLNELEKMLEKI